MQMMDKYLLNMDKDITNTVPIFDLKKTLDGLNLKIIRAKLQGVALILFTLYRSKRMKSATNLFAFWQNAMGCT